MPAPNRARPGDDPGQGGRHQHEGQPPGQRGAGDGQRAPAPVPEADAPHEEQGREAGDHPGRGDHAVGDAGRRARPGDGATPATASTTSGSSGAAARRPCAAASGIRGPTEATAASPPWGAGRAGSQSSASKAPALVTAEMAMVHNTSCRANSGSSSSGTAVAGVQVTLNQPIAARMLGAVAPGRPGSSRRSGQVIAEVAAPTSAATHSSAFAVARRPAAPARPAPRWPSAPPSSGARAEVRLQRARQGAGGAGRDGVDQAHRPGQQQVAHGGEPIVLRGHEKDARPEGAPADRGQEGDRQDVRQSSGRAAARSDVGELRRPQPNRICRVRMRAVARGPAECRRFFQEPSGTSDNVRPCNKPTTS